MFGDDRRRQINLGGINTTTSQASVLAQVQQQRQRRLNEKRAHDAASRIQARWRAYSAASKIRVQMNQAFDGEPIGTIASTRFLVFGGGERQRLVAWTNVALEADEAALFKPFDGPEAENWLVLLKQLTHIMLKQAVASPQAQESSKFLRFINIMVAQPPSASPAYSSIAPAILDYLLRRNLYPTISSCIKAIPVTSKSRSVLLPGLITLSVAPFKVFSRDSPPYALAFTQITTHILAIPLFPNRIPLPSLSVFSAQVPFQYLDILSIPTILAELSSDLDAIHLLANLLTFIPPRYNTTNALSLGKDALEVYIMLLNHLLSRIPVGSLDPPKSAQSTAMDWKAQDDSDDDNDDPRRSIREATPALPAVDSKTLTKLATLVTQTHITNLLNAANKTTRGWRQFVKFVLNIGHIRPTKRENVLNIIVIGSGGVAFKQLWREDVRTTPLGANASGNSLRSPQYADDWPALILLTELYTQALLTMGDDEFFSTSQASNKVVASKNPFTVSEVVSLSRKLLNIAFPLTWNEDSGTAGTELVPGLPISWETVRERLTKCLQAVHARDSRRPFTPPRHWLVTDQLDVHSFVEAAIVEEESFDDDFGVKDLTKRDIAYISPRLRILNNIPFAIPFEHRVSIFRSIVRNDKLKLQESHSHFGSVPLGKKVIIRRGNVAQDGFDHLNELGDAWKGRLAITFVDQFGQEEAGIDGGGVFKEFLTSLSKEVFDTDRGLWLATKQQELYPNSHSYAKESHQLNWYRFIGRVLGKALYEDILVDVAFAGFFLAKWLGKQSFLDDLASLDPELYQGLIFLKNYTGNPEELSLDFSITESDLGVTRTINLKPNGSNIPVTRENRLEYIYLVSHYRLTRQIKKQSDAFFEGLSQIINPRWLRMFNQQELKILVGGAEEPIDIDDLRSNALYGGLYDDNHPTIQLFWRVVKTLDQDKRRMLLRFVTSCARPPLLGFKELAPKFAIRDAGVDTSRLPTASTCVNLLKLPLYQDEPTLRKKLLHAISSGAGFDLS